MYEGTIALDRNIKHKVPRTTRDRRWDKEVFRFWVRVVEEEEGRSGTQKESKVVRRGNMEYKVKVVYGCSMGVRIEARRDPHMPPKQIDNTCRD